MQWKRAFNPILMWLSGAVLLLFILCSGAGRSRQSFALTGRGSETSTQQALTAREVPKQAGGPEEPVRYVGKDQVTPEHDGGLRLAVGVKSYQAFRANRVHPELAEGFGWTYNHAPMLAYWNGKFYLEYLSSPVNENLSPMQTLLLTSPDGQNWDKPVVAFPQYTLPTGKIALMHQRMGFHVAPNGRLLVIAFYGLGRDVGLLKGSAEEVPTTAKLNPNDGTGVGRVVREVYKNGTFGPIYFIRYNSHNGWNETNTRFPLYTASPDQGFKDACKELLENKLVTMQWWEEDRSTDGFYYPMGRVLKAFCYYHRLDGRVVGLWKDSWASLSSDNGRTWSRPAEVPSLVMAEGKVWGQRTPDERYALLYNPRKDNRHRWPLAIVTGDDGIIFENMLTVNGEVGLRRYNGLDKAFGPQYVRGITEGDGTPPGKAFWVTYSMNKDDIWVSRIPVPVRGRVEGPVHDTFDTGRTEDLDWDLYSPKWASIRIADFPSATNRSLELQDKEPHDYSKAVRVFPEGIELTVSFKVLAKQTKNGRLEIELQDRYGYRPPVRLFLNDQGEILVMDGNANDVVRVGTYKPGAWMEFRIDADASKDSFDLWINGKRVLEKAEFLDPVKSLERIAFRTGPYQSEPTLRVPKSPGEDLPDADEPSPMAVYHVDDVEIQVHKQAQWFSNSH